jgi:hypothetical protein
VGSVRDPKEVSIETDLARYEWVLHGVFNSVAPVCDETKASLRYNLFLLARNGIDDPERLREALIACARRSKALIKARWRDRNPPDGA